MARIIDCPGSTQPDHGFMGHNVGQVDDVKINLLEASVAQWLSHSLCYQEFGKKLILFSSW